MDISFKSKVGTAKNSLLNIKIGETTQYIWLVVVLEHQHLTDSLIGTKWPEKNNLSLLKSVSVCGLSDEVENRQQNETFCSYFVG